MKNITIVDGDITQAEVDAIVNAANPQMLGGGGVDGAIHRAAGPELLQACTEVAEVDGIRCPFGEARITRAGNLKSKFVIHVVGPIYQNESNPGRVLVSAYINVLNLALDNNCQSVAFPAISCGVYGYPHAEAAKIALQCCARPEYAGLSITFFLRGAAMVQVWRVALKQLVC